MLTLGISTSFSHFAMAIGENNQVLFNSRNADIPDVKRVETILEHGLQAIKKSVTDIGNIVVDNGPGGTSSVRTGVAFANSLGYSLGVGVAAVSSFALLGFDIYRKSNTPVLMTAKSIKGNAFWGYFNHNKLESLSYGLVNEILPQIIIAHGDLIVAGYNNDILQSLLPENRIIPSDLKVGDVEILIEHGESISSRQLKYPEFVIPITETNLVYG